LGTFRHNSASDGCIVFFTDVCTTFPVYALFNNTQTMLPTCISNYNALCGVNYEPPSAPVMPPIEMVPPANPPTVPVSVPSGCPGRPPTASAQCKNGVWIVPSSEIEILAPTIVISTPIVVDGNLTVPTITVTNVFGNGQALLQSNGCISIGSITVELSEEDVARLEKNGPRTALLTSSSCDSSSSIDVNGQRTSKKCKTIETEAVHSGGSLTATFRVSASGCNTWWIVLVSVVSMVIVGVIVAIVIVQMMKKASWKRKHDRLNASKS
jgi:hypothetical protein